MTSLGSLKAVIWKEFLVLNPLSWVTLLFVAILFGFSAPLLTSVGETVPVAQKTAVNGFVGYAPLFLPFFGGSFLMDLFRIERAQRTIESSLCTPMTVRQLWLGKLLAVFLIMYLWLVFTVAIYLTRVLIRFGSSSLPDAPAVVQLLVACPVLAFALLGAAGYIYLLWLAPMLVRMVNLFIGLAIFTLLLHGGGPDINWLTVSTMPLAGLLLFRLTLWLVGRIDKEKIIFSLRQ